MEPRHLKRNLLDDSDSESDDGGAPVGQNFKVNEDFARRFEHNKKREEKQRLEEKYKNGQADQNDDESSSSDETEDDEGFLATEDLDAQISATLQAIRNKDPRVYDKDITFYQGEDGNEPLPKTKKEKPVFLKDYQREKLLRGDIGGSDEETETPQTYLQEQDALKRSFLSEVDAAKEGEPGHEEEDSDEDDGFMKRKEPKKADKNVVHPARAAALRTAEVDVANADRDPDTFLSNFMASRAWVPEEGGRWKAFESDEGEEDDQADEFEQAYNMRFEDPEKSNEVLKSYSRQITAARSVRREEKTSRQRQRELEREQKEAEKKERQDEKARLRKLKLEEAEDKLHKIKHAAGAVGKNLTDEEWMSFLDEAWENDKWEEEMRRRFGDDYYGIDEGAAESDEEDEEAGDKKKSKNPKKPKWDDDIDIKDIIPDFEDDDAKPEITLSDSEGHEEVDEDEQDQESSPSKKRKTAEHKRARLDAQKKARQDRTKLEALVDSKLELTNHDLLTNRPSGSGGFRYRETSPQTFGMTARDILLAPSDADLNTFAGLKKLATFRDEEKKRRDKKRLGKKARLREWRRDVFGREFERTGPTYGFEKLVTEEDLETANAKVVEPAEEGNVVGDVGGSRKKRKRSKGKKGAETSVEA